ncbi:type VI secretion system baseplate subunit TssK [uncultured Shewanella sp.]|uniref:type VI secretion system baseplate subunit TssK n=1 Tax=uncultured Shewanella sp. TaxID=173975 RepID=UPI00261C60A8|nr:type VI secretion system baseplate subunit TssK [uncultured Shewanella sp.]
MNGNVKKIVWSEGMFISPQHFQQQERYIESYIKNYHHYYHNSDAGIFDIDFDSDLLKIGKFGLRSSSGVFPDGTPFHTDYEMVIDIPDDAMGKLIYLALPIYRLGVQDVTFEANSGTRHRSMMQPIFDSSRQDSEAEEVELSILNICLKMEGEDLEDYSVIEIAKIKEVKIDGGVILDQTYIPPCLRIKISDYILTSLKEIHADLVSHGQNLSNKLSVDNSIKADQIVASDYIMLQTIARWTPQVYFWMNTDKLAPQNLYYDLCIMAGEFSALNSKLLSDFHHFNCRDLFPLFSQLFGDIKILLRQGRESSVTILNWDETLFDKRRLLRIKVMDSVLYSSSRILLAVSCSLGMVETSKQFIASTKLGGNSRIAELVRNSVSGIAMTALPFAPNELKARANKAYFELDTDSPYWHEIVRKDEPIALHLNEKIKDFEIEMIFIR